MAVQKNNKTPVKTQEKLTETQEKKAEENSSGKIKVKILSTLRGTYGAFNSGEIAELGEKIANELVKAGLAEKA